ncbi:type IV pilus assembly protein PilW [Luteibacter sp. OK325]|jgi:type IV pilus assembly protein PilW|uniref:PilW family protein n=1 Tax=Luteibacter sp. OK325 TaxID=2135670 RepID=UPI000D3F2A85|nr:PilW family protein [Luteibacter sp. OK325]PTR32730.1 type IV pilus assembly protein PilW [Luteibacter sp. OK325]
MTIANARATRGDRGFTLVELMVAMALGVIVAGGIVSAFLATSTSSLVQTQLAKLQEEGRFAMTALTTDLRMTNAQYCSNVGGQSSNLSNGVMSLDRYLRAPTVLVSGAVFQTALNDNTTAWGTTSGGNTYPASPLVAFTMPSFVSLRGYDCTVSACTPVDPADPKGVGIPQQGTTVGNRVAGSSVLTLRYLDGARGWVLDGINSSITLSGNTVASLTVVPQAGEPALTNFTKGDLMMLADCNSSQVFSATASASTFTPASNYSAVARPSGVTPKLFDFNRDFQTVSYYLQVVDDNNGHKTGALIRRVNGVSGEVVRGIERLDFLYGVMDAAGNTSYRTAADIDSATVCPSSTVSVTGTDPGCLWRSVKSIEVHILMDGQVPLFTLAAPELQYQYYPDTGVVGLSAPDNTSRAVMPSQQGFDNHMLRREFTAVVSIRNYNP